MRPEEAPAVFSAARYLFISDRNLATVEDGTYRAWGRALADFSVDDCADAMQRMVTAGQERMPTLAALLTELRAARHRAELDARPVLAEPQPSRATRDAEQVKREVWESHLAEVERFIAESVRFERNGGAVVDPVRLADIRAECERIGPIEAAFLAKHGIEVEVTIGGGGPLAAAVSRAVDVEPEPLPRSTVELAEEWAVRWEMADVTEREVMREEAGSMSDELKQAIKAARAAMREVTV